MDMVDRLIEIFGDDKGWNGQRMTWAINRTEGYKIDFGGLSDPGSEQKYKGRPHDLIGFDEAVDFTEAQVRFLMTWNRSTRPGQRCRVIMASNPPAPVSSASDAKRALSGTWIIQFFGPWLDPQYKDPLGLGQAKPGDLRWYVSINGVDIENPDGVPFVHEYEDGRQELIIPQSRTFIPAKVQDNQYLAGTKYMSTLQSLQEPFRSIMLYGDFSLALSDRPLQVFPTSWVREAVARWEAMQGALYGPTGPLSRPMTALGLDVSRGGADATVAQPRYGNYYPKPHVVPGTAVPDGPVAAGIALSQRRNDCPVVVDVVGVGGSAYDHARLSDDNFFAYAGSHASELRDISGMFGFTNKRSASYWKFREALDPKNQQNVCLYPDPELMQEMAVVTYEILGKKIKVLPKEKVNEALVRSSDKMDGVIMASTVIDDEEPTVVSFEAARQARVEEGRRGPMAASIRSGKASWTGRIDYGPDTRV